MAAHCIASTDGDLKLMAARGATVLNCPRVFARSGVTAAFGRFAEHGVRTVVGTDGYNMDLLGELNAASMISKIASARADVANAPELIESVTATAAMSSSGRISGDRAGRNRRPHRCRSDPSPFAAAVRSAARAGCARQPRQHRSGHRRRAVC
jgi:hypothetical protein